MTNSKCDSVCQGTTLKTDGTKASQAAGANKQATTNIACTQCTSGCGQDTTSGEVKQDLASSSAPVVPVVTEPVANNPAPEATPAPAPADPGTSQITGSEIQSGGKKRYRSRKRQKTKKNKRKSKKSKKSRKNKRKTKRKNRKLH